MRTELGRSELAWMRRLFWLYLILLVTEGVFRKWILPGYSNVLLVIRDPVAMLIYFLAFQRGMIARDPWIISITALGVASFAASFMSGTPRLIVPLFGWRANFLHLPLVFLVPKFMQREDIMRMGKAVLVMSVPIAMLTAYQFASPRDSWINVTAGGQGMQMDNSAGGVRPAGPFSFVTGNVFYFSLVAAFMLHALLTRRQFPILLVFLSLVSTLVAASVSGSRSLIGGLVVVALFGLVGMLNHPPTLARSYRVIFLGGAALVVVRSLDIFKKGGAALARRIEVASAGQEGGQIYYLSKRMLESFYVPLDQVTLVGQGLGLGTNVGASMVYGTLGFYLAENEWSRVLIESGIVLGTLFLVFRTAASVYLAVTTLRAARKGDMLPLLLAGSGFMLMLSGQLGPPVSGGFIAVCCGLALAAAAHPPLQTAPAPVTPAFRQPGRRRTVVEVAEPVGSATRGADPAPHTVQPRRRAGKFSVRPE